MGIGQLCQGSDLRLGNSHLFNALPPYEARTVRLGIFLLFVERFKTRVVKKVRHPPMPMHKLSYYTYCVLPRECLEILSELFPLSDFVELNDVHVLTLTLQSFIESSLSDLAIPAISGREHRDGRFAISVF